MTRKVTEDEKWEIVGYVKSSSIRYAILKTLDTEFLMPTEIAQKTEKPLAQVSIALKSLKSNELIVCKNENARKGRLYKNTELALEILSMIDENNV